MTAHRVYNDFSAGIVDTGTGEMVPPNGLWAGENFDLNTRGSVKTRAGTTQFADTISGTTRILGFHTYYKYSTGVYYPIMVFNDDVYVESSSTWTAQSQSLTANLEMGFVNAFDKVYMNNGTDSTRIFDGSSVTTDASFPKGVIMAFHENRIMVAIGDTLYYSDLGTVTFQTTSTISLERKITGLLAGDYYLYIFTETDMYRIAQFEQYDGVAYGPEKLEKMPCHVGTVAHRSLVNITRNIYTLTRYGVYRIEEEGLDATRISEDCETSFAALDPDYLVNASAVPFDDKYVLAVRDTGQDYNNKIFIFDTRLLHQSVFGTDEKPTFLPAFYKYTYTDAELYPRVLAIVPSSTGEPRLMFGNEATGETFQMETGTDDNGGDFTAFAEKPLLSDVRPDLIKRLMKAEFSWEELGAYDVKVAFKNDDYADYSDENVDMTALGDVWGFTFIWGSSKWGAQTTKKTFKRPHLRGYFFYARVKSDTADEPFEFSRIGCMFRIRGRYQPQGTG